MKKFLIGISLLMALPCEAQTTRSGMLGYNTSTFTNCGTNCITGPILQNWNSTLVNSAGFLRDNNSWTGRNIFNNSLQGAINLAPAAPPSAPQNGDLWITATEIYAQIGGVSYNLLAPSTFIPSLTTRGGVFAQPGYIDGTGLGHGANLTGQVLATDYPGVDRTGTTDSTAGLTAAISSSAGAGLSLILPCGTYLVDAVPLATGANISAVSRRCSALKRKPSAAGTSILSASGINNFVVDGLTFDGNPSGNPGTPVTLITLSNSYNFSIRNNNLAGMVSIDAATYGVGINALNCQDVAQGTNSDISNNSVQGLGTSATLSGIIAQRCGNLNIVVNTVSGGYYSGITLNDQTLPVPTTPTNFNVKVIGNRVSYNGVGIYVAGANSGPGLGGVLTLSRNNFVNSNIVVSDNIMDHNYTYGCEIQASVVTVANNVISNNGTNYVYGGCAITTTLFSITGNTIVNNSYYGLDVGGSSFGTVEGNTIRQNGASLGTGIGMNIGGVSDITIGVNNIGGNGGAGGGFEVLGSALDGAGPGNFAPWIGTGLTIKGLKISIGNAAMSGLVLNNGWTYVDVSDVTVSNLVGSAQPFTLLVGGPSMQASNNKIIDNTGAWTPSIASASTIIVPDGVDTVNITGSATVNNILSYAQNALNGGLREFIPSNTGNGGYTAGATASCSSTGGTPATVTPGVSANGHIYGLYVLTPGSGASAMSCSASDQTCTATPGAVSLSGGAVVSVGVGTGGSGCANPPAVIISGLTCTNPPMVHAAVSGGVVTGYTVDYGGSGCSGTGTASILNGSGFAGTAYLGAGPYDKFLNLRFTGTAQITNGAAGTGAVYLGAGGTYTGSATGSLGLRSLYGNWTGTYRQ